MKTEERHKLHEHELQKLTRQAGEFWTRHGNKLLIGLAAIVVVAAGILWWVASSHAGAAAGWTELANSTSAEKLAAIAEDYSGQPAGWWSRLKAAELHVHHAVRQSFSDRPAARDELGEALEALDRLLSAGSLPERLHERALFAQARALETQAAIGAEKQEAASLEVAIAAYEKLLDSYPQTVFKEIAESRKQALEAERTREFVAWFSRQTPKPEDRPLPQDGLPGSGAGAQTGPSVSMPEVSPELQLPSTDDGEASGVGPPPDESATGNAAPPFPDSAEPAAESPQPSDAEAPASPSAGEAVDAERPAANDGEPSAEQPSPDAAAPNSPEDDRADD